SGDGGAIMTQGDGGSQIASSSFQSNLTEGDGGAIYEKVLFGYTDIANCSFMDNVAAGRGGAVYTERGEFSSNLQVKNSRFIHNQAVEGGAIRFYVSNRDLSLDVVNSLFSGNIASQTGSAVYTYASSESLQTTFINTT